MLTLYVVLPKMLLVPQISEKAVFSGVYTYTRWGTRGYPANLFFLSILGYLPG